MDFISKLRMNNLFSDQNRNPLGPPEMGNPMEMFHRIYPYIVQEKERDFNHQKELMQMQHPQLQHVANSMNAPPEQQKPMNVVFKDTEPSEFQKRSLALKDKDITGDQQVANRRLDITQQKNVSDEKNKQQRTSIYDFKAKNPGLKVITTKGGTVKFFNPATGETHDTGIDSGTLSDEDKIELSGDQNIRAIDERGTQSRETQKERSNQNLEAIGARASGQIRVNENKPAKDMLPTQSRVNIANKARQLSNSNPELSKFITFDQSGNPQVAEPSTHWYDRGSPTQEQYDTIRKILYPEEPISGIKTSDSKVETKSGSITEQQAKDALIKNKIPVNPENIKKAMDPKNWK